jgi:hypothetical protein
MNNDIADRPAQGPHVVTLNPQGVLNPALTALRKDDLHIAPCIHQHGALSY